MHLAASLLRAGRAHPQVRAVFTKRSAEYFAATSIEGEDAFDFGVVAVRLPFVGEHGAGIVEETDGPDQHAVAVQADGRAEAIVLLRIAVKNLRDAFPFVAFLAEDMHAAACRVSADFANQHVAADNGNAIAELRLLLRLGCFE